MLRACFLLWLLCFCMSISMGASNVVIRSPPRDAVFFNRNGSLISVLLAYDLANEFNTELYAFCFYLTKTDESKQYSENCFMMSIREIAINEVGAGDYLLTYYLREIDLSTQSAQAKIEESAETRIFRVLQYEDMVPLLTVESDGCNELSAPKTISFPVNQKSHTATAELKFSLVKRQLPIERFYVCLELVASDGVALLKESCLLPGQIAATLNNLPLGTYTLQMGLKELETENIIPSSRSRSELVIYDLRNSVTYIDIADHSGLVRGPESDLRMEYTLNAQTQRADTPFTVVLRTTPCSAEKLISVCLQLHEDHQHQGHQQGQESGPVQPLLPRTCLPPSARTLTPQRLPAGTFSAVVSLHDARKSPANTDGFVFLPIEQANENHTLRALIETRQQVELEPTYEWQRLRAWHSVPAGMDIRLPIGGTGHKEARIPQPWRLQALLPKGCNASFLRMDLTRRSTIGDIRRRAEELCQNMPGKYSVYGDGYVVEPDDTTVEVAKLFQKKVLIAWRSINE